MLSQLQYKAKTRYTEYRFILFPDLPDIPPFSHIHGLTLEFRPRLNISRLPFYISQEAQQNGFYCTHHTSSVLQQCPPHTHTHHTSVALSAYTMRKCPSSVKLFTVPKYQPGASSDASSSTHCTYRHPPTSGEKLRKLR